MATRNKVNIKICGIEYTLVGVESEEYLQRVSMYIDRKMNEITKINSKLSTSMAAVLTAINVADDYFKCYEKEAQLKKELKYMEEDRAKLKEEIRRLSNENAVLANKNSGLQVDITKRDAELEEVKSLLDKATSPRK